MTLLIALVAAVPFSGRAPSFNPESDWLVVLSIILAIVGIGGLLLITAVEPNPKGRPPSSTVNRTARWLLMLCLFAALLGWLFSENLMAIPHWLGAFAPLSIFLMASSMILVLICLRRLAIRARRTGLRRMATVMIWLIGVEGLLTCAAQVFFALAMPQFQSMAATGATVPYGPSVPGASTTLIAGGASTTSADSSGEEAEDVSAATAPQPVVVYGPASTGTTVVTGGPATVVVPAVPGWMIFFGFFSCGNALLMVITFLLGLVLLVLYRRMLTQAMAPVN